MSSVSRSVGRPVARSVLAGQLNTLASIIKSLFANNEQGFAYDPNDISTLYQDAAGTTPVTAAEQPVGLMLDKSAGLVIGIEKAINGDLSSGLTGWLTTDINTTVALVNGRVRATLVSASNPRTSLKVDNLVIGNWYTVKIDFYMGTLGTSAVFRVAPDERLTGITVESNLTASKSAQMNFRATATTMYFGVVGLTLVVGQYFDLDNVSVKEVFGNHAYQTQSAMRPLLVAAPQRLDYDTADDKLITSLPTQLTGCTVIRSVPNVGTQILTNQTIQTTYNDNIDNCGLIVINRALTASETSQITKLFNKAAGV